MSHLEKGGAGSEENRDLNTWQEPSGQEQDHNRLEEQQIEHHKMNHGGSLKQSDPAPPTYTAFDPGLEDGGVGLGRSQEELDLELALRLSKADHEQVDQVQHVPELEHSQEDADRLFALRLQQELNSGAEHVTSSPPVGALPSRSPGPEEEMGEEQEDGGDLLGRLLGADPVLGRGRAAGAGSLLQTPPSKKVKKKKPVSCIKEYVPKPRSGAEAALLALAQAAAQPGYPGHLGKAELQRLAQPGADQSFTLAGNRTEHYTAWAGVKTLINHELIRRWSNPAKFDITEKGVELAGRILRVGGAGGSGPTGTVHGRGAEGGAENSPVATGRKRKKTVLKDDDGVANMIKQRLARFSADAENRPPAAQPSTSAANFSLGLAESFSLEGTLTEAEFAGPVPLPLELQVLFYPFF